MLLPCHYVLKCRNTRWEWKYCLVMQELFPFNEWTSLILNIKSVVVLYMEGAAAKCMYKSIDLLSNFHSCAC